ncbi:MAG: trypsin-like peptidase domain-containing protein [Acidobacteria bacterium]|nr:trypsin-like peptidase domain-containing protein [Acidobacteriota bacterium]
MNSFRRRAFLPATAALALVLALPAAAAEDVADAVKLMRGSMVLVRGADGATVPGVLIDDQGHVATAAQYVHQAMMADVLFDGRTIPAHVVAIQSLADLALLKLDTAPAPGRAARIADSDKVELGQRAIVIGGATAGSPSLGVGYITGRRMANLLNAGLTPVELFETDAALRADFAGGALVNVKGELIGIVTGISSAQSGGTFGYAIASNAIRQLFADAPPWGGAEALFLNAETAALLNLPQPALLVQRVVPGSNAERLGLRGGTVPATVGRDRVTLGGDVVLEIGGVSVAAPDAAARIREVLQALKPGSTISVVVLRGGQRQDLKLTLPSP